MSCFRAGPQLAEVEIGVSQSGRVNNAVRLQQSFDGVSRIPDVRVHGGGHSALVDPERNKPAAGQVAPNDNLVINGCPAPVFHPEVVLVRKEVRRPVVGDLHTEHVLGRYRALVESR